MSQTIPERDWKCMKRLRDDLLSGLCKGINAQAAEILAEVGISEYEKYLKLFNHQQKSDRTVAECFDDWRRSTLMMRIYSLHQHEVLREEHVRQLSDETQQRLEMMTGL